MIAICDIDEFLLKATELSARMENEERVFLTYRAVFEGQNAQIRQQKAILKIINKHGKSAQTLLKSLGEKYVIGTLKSLLERKVFQSELEAKLAFPDLFKTSLAQDVQHNASEADAARSEVEALEDVASLMGDADDVSEIANEIPSVPHPASRSIPLLPRYPLRSSTAVSVQPLTNGIEIPSLYPVYIPFKTQHLVLNKTQQLLEECCYDFSTQWMPELLKQRRWDCPEAIELNKWTHSVVNRLDKLPQSCSSAFADDSRSSVASCLISINKLRHSAVHRLPTTAKGISEMIHSAIRFARVLRDSAREQQLTKLDYELQGKFRALALNKNYLETKLERELQEIARQRRELDNKEKEAVVMISREDEDHQSLIASLLSNSVQQIFDGHEDKAPEATEAERSSDHEMEVEEGQGYASISDEDGQVELDPPTKEKPITDRGTGSEEREPNLVHQSFIQAGPSASPPAASSLCHEICNQEDHKLKNSPKLHLENETPCTLDSQADLILAIEPMGNTPTTTHGIAMAEAEVGDSKSSPSDYSIPQKVYGRVQAHRSIYSRPTNTF